MTHRHPPTSNATARLHLGIDVGGTNVKLGLVDDAGQILAQTSTPTRPLGTPEAVFACAMQFAGEQLRLRGGSDELAGVGLAVPGVLDTTAMALREVVNLPGWLDQPLLELLSEAAGVPAMVVNDANAAALAEHARRGLGPHSLALVTLGTGIGCGLVVGGYPHGGDHGCAGELGHIAVRFDDQALPCTCGSRGHLEAYAGSGGVVARLRSAFESTADAEIPQGLAADSVTPREIAAHAADGDAICLGVIDETAHFVGAAIGMLAQVVDPAVVLLGGAMTFGGPDSVTGIRFIEHIRKTVRDTTLEQVGQNLIVDFASLGNDAGILGAALVARQAAADASIHIATHSD
ncbi:ROK family protein [Allorhodopirellula solitaria]|uniref:ROK family protein n=1 Tax=Allorhodopirellula solitaria TaxID=2527987 RepID=UPI001FE77A16|nr:ROK family protein [Allorhodopirellula solitaria]